MLPLTIFHVAHHAKLSGSRSKTLIPPAEHKFPAFALCVNSIKPGTRKIILRKSAIEQTRFDLPIPKRRFSERTVILAMACPLCPILAVKLESLDLRRQVRAGRVDDRPFLFITIVISTEEGSQFKVWRCRPSRDAAVTYEPCAANGASRALAFRLALPDGSSRRERRVSGAKALLAKSLRRSRNRRRQGHRATVSLGLHRYRSAAR